MFWYFSGEHLDEVSSAEEVFWYLSGEHLDEASSAEEVFQPELYRLLDADAGRILVEWRTECHLLVNQLQADRQDRQPVYLSTTTRHVGERRFCMDFTGSTSNMNVQLIRFKKNSVIFDVLEICIDNIRNL